VTFRVSSAISLPLGFALLGAISVVHAAACTAGSGSALDNTLFNSVGLNPATGGCTVNTPTPAGLISGNSNQLPVHPAGSLQVQAAFTGSQYGSGGGGGEDDDHHHHVVPLPPSDVLLASGALTLFLLARRRRTATD
jgi:hypothetical protein